MKLLGFLSLLTLCLYPCDSIDTLNNSLKDSTPAKSITDPLIQDPKVLEEYGEVSPVREDLSLSMLSTISHLFPTPRALLDATKQVIGGFPFDLAFTAINELCSQVNAFGFKSLIQPVIDKMAFVLIKPCKRTSFPLKEVNTMWKSPEFDPKKKVVIVVTGWTTDINEPDTIPAISKAYLCRGGVNVIALDAGAFVDTLYSWSSLNTEEIGKLVADGLVKLTETISPDDIHLIGHSLGAHIVGFAGRYYNIKTGKQIARVTGLDPAKPCFKEGETLNGLYRGDGKVVDIIHTNPGVLGKREPLGDIDFYPNGLNPLAKGCLTIVCAHGRAWEYYAESVYPGNENNFMASRCNSLTALMQNKCPTDKQPMGYAAPLHLKGNYFLEVNSIKPYGKNYSKDPKQFAECGLCNEKKGTK